MRVECPGWRDKDGRRVHEGVLVLVDDPADTRAPSSGICRACKEAFLERAALYMATREAQA